PHAIVRQLAIEAGVSDNDRLSVEHLLNTGSGSALHRWKPEIDAKIGMGEIPMQQISIGESSKADHVLKAVTPAQRLYLLPKLPIAVADHHVHHFLSESRVVGERL